MTTFQPIADLVDDRSMADSLVATALRTMSRTTPASAEFDLALATYLAAKADRTRIEREIADRIAANRQAAR